MTGESSLRIFRSGSIADALRSREVMIRCFGYQMTLLTVEQNISNSKES